MEAHRHDRSWPAEHLVCAGHEPSAVDTPGEARKILTLTRSGYNKSIGLMTFRRWLDKAKKKSTKHDFVGAQDSLSARTLKGVHLEVIEANMVAPGNG